jgi:7-cyano-7-deazaguanine tRNA-ribosyltransferase
MSFEIKDRDLAARIGRLQTAHGVLETPTIFPVINPNKLVIEPAQMNKYGAQGIITNAYILWKDWSQEVIDKGVHAFLNYDGPIMSDSGAFQLMEYGDISVTNKEIIQFQERIGVDIGVILDIPTIDRDYDVVKAAVETTIERAKEAQGVIKDTSILWCGPVQGNVHADLLKKSCTAMSRMDFAIHPIGSVVPLLREYRFAPHVEIIRNAKESLPANRPIHLFGAGHPMFFAFAVALGVDLFDSAAYALYAADDRYLTQVGTHRLEDMEWFPCACPVCSSMTPAEMRKDEMKERLLAEHNLYVTFQELRAVKQAIKDKTLWELLERRARAHPALLECMKHVVTNTDFIAKYDPITKPHFFDLSSFSRRRPEAVRAKQRTKEIRGPKIDVPPFGFIPAAVYECYPFTQTVSAYFEKPKARVDDDDKLRGASMYWYGADIFPEKMTIQRSRATGKVRAVYAGKKLLATVRANDYMIILHEIARQLHKETEYPRFRVAVSSEDPEMIAFIKKGKSVFAKFVTNCDQDIIPGQQVLVVTEKDELLGAGEALLNPKEMSDFKRGAAVLTRWLA